MSIRARLTVKAGVVFLFGALTTRVLLYAIGFVVMLILLLLSIWAYTEVRWYMAVGYADVLVTMFLAKLWMGLFPFVAMSLAVILNMNIARKLAPIDRIISADERTVDRWRRALEPFARPLITAIGLICGLLLALQTFPHWETYLLWRHGDWWGRPDPQFGRDLSYFMFDLKFYTLVNRQLFIGLLVILILCAITSYLFGGLRPQAPGAKIPPQVNVHFSLILVGLMVLLGWGMILELHLLSYSERGVITGLGFTDANASLIAYQFVATGVVTGFILLQINIRKPGWILPTIALIWLFLIGLSIARFYPNIYQILIVDPQELEREYPYIENHLEFTRYGFDLDKVERRNLQGDLPLTGETIDRYREALDRTRLWDPDTLRINFNELQALRSYYDFRDVDVDRYRIDGELVPVMIGAREIDQEALPAASQRWQSHRMIYTHGFGLVAASVSQATESGKPVFYAQDMPVKGIDAISDVNPRLYYGENLPEFSFVDTETIELDRPADESERVRVNSDIGDREPEEGLEQLIDDLEDGPTKQDLDFTLSDVGDRIERMEGKLPDELSKDSAGSNGEADATDWLSSLLRRLEHATEDVDQPGARVRRQARQDASSQSQDDSDAGGGDTPEKGSRAARGECAAEYNESPETEGCATPHIGFAYGNYEGDGGVLVHSIWERLAFALRLWDLRLALTLLLDDDTKVMFHRNVRERVRRVAPYLKIDRNPYPVAVDGRILWVVDAYTVSDMMPYSRRVNLTDLTQVDQPKQHGTTLIPEEFIRSEAGLSGTANYLRNSVKAVVDAYHGTVSLYVIDPSDQVLQTWRRAFPDSYLPLAAASEGLQAHFRYPHDLFRIQAVVWSDYHMRTPEAFYTREAAWRIPPDAAFISLRRERERSEHDGRRADMRPYWLHALFPGEEEEQFALVQPFSPDQRNVLTGYLAGFSDGGDYGRLVAYSFPPTQTVTGPPQAQARIDQDTRVSAWMTLRMQSGSRVSRGRLLVLPVGGSLIYVQPLFVQADKSSVSQLLGAQLSSIPELKKVVVLYGDRVVMRDTLSAALDAAFQSDRQQDASLSTGEGVASSASTTNPSGPDGASR